MKLFMPMLVYDPPRGNALGSSYYKQAMLAKLLADALKAGLIISTALYKDEAWYVCNGQYICPVACNFNSYAYACKVLRPQIRAAKHSATMALLEGIERADLLKALKALGYKVQ